jgi:ABC-2 type transport system permease protein
VTAGSAAFIRPPLPRLARVELRKMTDTRAGFWLLVLAGLGAVTVVAAVLAAGNERDQTMAALFRAGIWATGLFLPIIGLLAVTGEWSQRTALSTFALVPEPERVVGAKLLAGCALAPPAVLLSLLAAVIGTGIAGGSWSFTVAQLAYGVLFALIGTLGAMAIGVLLRHSGLALATYFLVPSIVGALVQVVPSLSGPAEWFELNQAMGSLADHSMGGTDWAKLTVATAIWIGAPIVAGLLRLRKLDLG